MSFILPLHQEMVIGQLMNASQPVIAATGF
jgi:hypothetical protein